MINLLSKCKIPGFRYFLLFLLQLTVFIVHCQTPINVLIKNTTQIASDSTLPFWFTANRHGKVKKYDSFWNISDISIGQTNKQNEELAVGYTWGGSLIYALGESDFYYQLNQIYAGISVKNWALTAGAFYDPICHAGLSTTNGNLARSRNARPYPMIRLSTLTYKPVPLLNDWLRFKAEYDEGILNDNRYVHNARIHHKSLYFFIQPSLSWAVHAGFEHYVMWGGTSKDEEIGKMPQNFRAYLRYITGTSGDDDFPQTDQNNVSGNQLGTYQLEAKKKIVGADITFYLSHPFEDLSGVNWRNWPDNLLGLHLHFKNKKPWRKQWLTDIVYEFTNTRQQSIRDSLYEWNETFGEWERQEEDNYFNHSIYKSGLTYHQQVMASPLFFPVLLDEDGVSNNRYALNSTRFYAHHIGFKGYLHSEHFQWKGLLTYIRHSGTYSEPFSPAREQLSGLIDLQYANPWFPVELGLSVAFDKGNVIHDNWGLEFRIAKRLYH